MRDAGLWVGSMPDPQPVRPRRKDETAYYRALRRVMMGPMMADIRAGVTEAASASQAIDAIDGVDWDRYQRAGLVEDEIAAQSVKLQGYHKARLIQTFRASVGVDIRGVLSDGEIDSLMSVWREENVRLVRTIPPRLHDGLLNRVSARRSRRRRSTGRRYLRCWRKSSGPAGTTCGG